MIASPIRTSFRVVLAGLAFALFVSVSAPIVGGDVLAARRGKPNHGISQERKGKRPKTKTVTRTFTSASAITIPNLDDGVPADPYPSTLEVRGLEKGRIVDLDLTLRGFQHDFPLDVDILLVKGDANPTAVQVIGDVGDASGDDVAFITLDDEATESLPFFEGLTAGRFRPTDHDEFPDDPDTFPAPAPQVEPASELAAFDGLNANGTWRLFVFDARNTDGGSIDGWELTMEVKLKGKKKR
jgi:hypothetical protein